MDFMNFTKTVLPYKPAINRRGLFIIAGSIWAAVGLLLCLRAYGWVNGSPAGEETALLGSGILIAGAGYRYGFSKVTQKNITRIHSLPERVCLFAFTAWRGYIMIGLMVTIGITLRSSSLPKIYLVTPYFAMGGALIAGSIGFFREFARRSPA